MSKAAFKIIRNKTNTINETSEDRISARNREWPNSKFFKKKKKITCVFQQKNTRKQREICQDFIRENSDTDFSQENASKSDRESGRTEYYRRCPSDSIPGRRFYLGILPKILGLESFSLHTKNITKFAEF